MAVDNKKLAELMADLAAGATHEETLNAAYQIAFGRDVDPDGLAYWGGGTREW